MKRKIGLSLALASALTMAQLPLGIVQVCAWVGMFNGFVVETGSVETSLEWTFDGQHGCEGCDFVSSQVAESDEKQDPSVTGATYLKLLLVPLVVDVPVVESPSVVGEITCDTQLLLCEVADPVTPPPRCS